MFSFLTDPCDGFICSEQTVCLLDDKRKPVCLCNLMCSPEIATVCGTDGITYSNDCYLRTEACRSQRDIKVYHHGSCDNREQYHLYPILLSTFIYLYKIFEEEKFCRKKQVFMSYLNDFVYEKGILK